MITAITVENCFRTIRATTAANMITTITAQDCIYNYIIRARPWRRVSRGNDRDPFFHGAYEFFGLVG